MIANLLSFDEARDFRADVAFVGSGAGSLAVAGELGRRGAKVLMLEAGPALEGAPGRHRLNVLPNLDAYMAELGTRLRPHAGAATPWPGLEGATSIHAVGGMLSYWANMTPRPDLELEWDGAIPKDVMSAYLDRADRLFHSTEDLYGEGSERQRWVSSQLAAHFGDGFVRPVRFGRRRLADGGIEHAAGDSLLEGVREPVAIVPEAVVRRIVVEGGRARALEAVNPRDGGRLRVEADVIVVGGGVIGTPQLLFASGFGGLPALGGYLIDHIGMMTRTTLKEGAPAEREDDPPVSLRVPVAPSRDFQAGVMNPPWTPSTGADKPTAMVGCSLGADPIPENRLLFDTSRLDDFGLPSMSADVRLTAADHARVRRALALQHEMAEVIGDPRPGMTTTFAPYASFFHLMGSYRLGTDPATSVTDTNCRVWGYENLYLAGNGLLGTRNHCNPTLTTVALGLVAADAIAGR